MKNWLSTALWIAFTVVATYTLSEWAVHIPREGKPVKRERPVIFEEVYPQYIEKVTRSKYQERLPLEIERMEKVLAILKAQAEQQAQLIKEARRP